MGGSSLAPEVLRRMLGVRPGCLELTVLDNTSPAAVRAVRRRARPGAHAVRGLLEVGRDHRGRSRSRRTSSTGRARRAGDAAGAAFVAITDPGSPLEAAGAPGAATGACSSNPPDVGGRYSALSLFGLVPAALIGADLEALLGGAARELDDVAARRAAGEPRRGARRRAGRRRAGRRATSSRWPSVRRWAPFGAWVEQLVAESTGKDGRGIVPVDGEAVGPAALARADRAFAVTPDLERGLGQAMRPRAERPAWLVDLPAPAGLGAAFLRWEIATAAAAAVLGVDPFDEPNVAEAKQATAAVLEQALAAGSFPEDGPRLAPGDAAVALRALLDAAGPADYVALLAYLHATPPLEARLARVRTAAAAGAPAGAPAAGGSGSGIATTLGYGPRYLHSTGQLHKGGPGTGIYLQLTAAEEPDLAIPGERYSFGMLRRSQAAGDYQTLATRGRRVLRLDLGSDPAAALDALATGLERR